MKEIDKIPLDRPIGIDFETYGLKDYRPDLLGVAWATESGYDSVVFEIEKMSDKQQEKLRKRIEKAKLVIAHNVYFELRVLYYWGVNVGKLFGKIGDSMFVYGVMDTSLPKGLKDIAGHVGMTLGTYKESLKAGRAEFIDYCRDDAITCLKLYEKYYPQLAVTKTDVTYEMEIRLVWVVLKMYINGFFVDTDYLNSLKSIYYRGLSDIETKLFMMAGKEVNFGSTKQLANLLFDDMGATLLPKYKTAKGNISTNEEVLKDVASNHRGTKVGKFCKGLLIHRGLTKFDNTYLGDNFLGEIEADGRIRSNLNQMATKTSRFSSSDPNLQNIPSSGLGFKMRKAFTASPGNKLLQIDYSQIEFRVIVHYMQDSNLIEAYKRGEDFHTATAKQMGVDRTLGKKLNFTLLYLGGVGKLAETLGVDKGQAKEYYDLYHNGLPLLKKFYEGVEAATRMTGYTRMMSGRRRGFIQQINEDKYITSECGNTIVQGNSGELLKMAMIEVDRILPSDVKMLMQIHDELIFEGKEKILKEIAPEIQHIMENVYEFSVPIIAEPKIVNNWMEAK